MPALTIRLLPKNLLIQKKWRTIPLTWRLACLCLAALAMAPPCLAEENSAAKNLVEVVTILAEDTQGEPLRFPSAVSSSRDDDEIYVVNGGRGGIVIYGADFFPHLFLGAGRGIEAPQHVFFDKETGNILVCQGRTLKHPPKLSILNAALLPDREIVFADMPGAEDFSPIRGAIGKNGTIYLIGANSRGALVLDKKGSFLRWLAPMDITQASLTREESATQEKAEKQPKEEEQKNEADNDPELLGLPSELLPKSRAKISTQESSNTLRPVMLNDLAIGSDGHIFLLSEETSKVYVYTAGEKPLFTFGQKGGSTGKMSRPRGIALDETKKCVYVVDYMRHTILVFDLGGKYIFEFGGRGNGPLWFNFPNAISVDRKGNLAVADLFNNRVQILKTEFSTSFPVFQDVKNFQPPGPKAIDPSPAEKSP